MADSATTRGKYRKQGLGDRLNAWGLSNGINGVFDVLDDAIHGVDTFSLTGNKTLSTTNYTTNESRLRMLRFEDGGLSSVPTVTIPATENWWVMDNAGATYDITVSNGSNSVTLSVGQKAIIYTDGTNVYKIAVASSLVAPDPGSNGVVVRTAEGTTVARTITGTANEITLADGDGVSGNPTISIPTAVTFTGKTITGGTFAGPTITGVVDALGAATFQVEDVAFSIADNLDNTKVVQFQASGITTGTTRTLTVPDADLTIVGTATTQTLTNKTVSGGTITGTIDASGATFSDLGTVTTADIDGGSVDGATVGASSASTGAFTTLTASGNVTFPGTPAFLAALSSTASNVTGDGTQYIIIPDSEIFDQGADYNNTTGVFTAPVTGRYRFDMTVCLLGLTSSHTKLEIILTTSNRAHVLYQGAGFSLADSGGVLNLAGSRLVDMDAADTARMEVKVSNGTLVVDVYGQAVSAVYTSFGGRLEC